MEAILREIDNRIVHKRIELLKKDLQNLSEDTENQLKELKKVDKVYYKVLEKDKPVGRGINAIRYLNKIRYFFFKTNIIKINVLNTIK